MKHIHFIGICGVAMSAIAIAFHKAGYAVTGSDAGFFPPVSTELEKHGIRFYPGWHPEKMIENGTPDLVVVGNVASSSNPEWTYVQEHHLAYKSYPEVMAEFFIKKNSIVCAGTYGKTSSTALLSWILSDAGFDPSYMFGGLAIAPERGEFLSARLGGGDWSVAEGDEYKSARWDMRPKFAHYAPTHLLLTGLAWDHADVYPTEEAYFDAFRKLVSGLPEGGVLVANTDNEKIRSIVPLSHCPTVTYGNNNSAMYQWSNVIQSADGLQFDILHKSTVYRITSPMLGDYQAANITGCFAMAMNAGIGPEKIIASIATFRGMKRRLEKRYEAAITIFDDIAHSPTKASATLQTLRATYAGKIIAVYEPNTGNRRQASIPGYDHAFRSADQVIIPRLTAVKKDPNDPEEILDGQTLSDVIAKTHGRVTHIDDDKAVVEHIVSSAAPGDVVVFLGSHGFRGMIEALIAQLKKEAAE